MRLTIVGGGGFRVPLVYAAVARARERVRITEVMLTDTDSDRLAVMQRVLADLATGSGADLATGPGLTTSPPLPVRATTDLDEALRGAAIIFAALRIGGTRGRITDERIALARGVLGQETVGAGGLAYAIRTLGPMEDLARRAARLAPEAWIINFTNPAGLITEAMRTHTPRVVGICDTPIALVRRVARALEIDVDDADIGYIGLNHLGWLHILTSGGVDHLPRLLADPGLLSQIEEARTLGVEWVQTLGSIPNEYLYYYYFTREAIASITRAPATRGEFLHDQQTRFYAEAAGAAADNPRAGERPNAPAARWQAALAEREATYMAEARAAEREEEDLGGGYHEVAVDLMAGLVGEERNRMILALPNAGAIPALPPDAVIEIPCEVGAGAITQLRPAAALDLDQLGLVTAVKAAERALIDAVRAGSRAGAWRAFAAHPLVDSAAVARDLVGDYIAADELIAAALPHP